MSQENEAGTEESSDDTVADEVVADEATTPAPVEAEAPAEDAADDDGGSDVDGAPTAQAVLEYVVTALVQDEDAVQVEVDDSKRTLQLEVRVGPDDMGRVIGRRGRVANAIRTLTRAAAARDGVEVDIEFLD